MSAKKVWIFVSHHLLTPIKKSDIINKSSPEGAKNSEECKTAGAALDSCRSFEKGEEKSQKTFSRKFAKSTWQKEEAVI